MRLAQPLSVLGRICALIVVLGMVACASAAPTPTPKLGTPIATVQNQATPPPVELVIWSELFVVGKMVDDPNGMGRYGTYLKQQFEKEHPGVTIKFEYHGFDEELRQNLVTALRVGNAPDIVVGENYFQQYAELQALTPLDDVVADIKSNLIPGTYRAAESDNHIYGLSAFTGVFGFERNCKVIQATGLNCDQPPRTWKELSDQVKTITQKGNSKYYGYSLQGPVGFAVGSVFRIALFMAQSGASLCKNNCTDPYFNNPKAIPVLEFIRELNRSTPPGLTFNPDEEQVYSQLFQGISAYQIAGSWHPKWAKDSGCEDCRYSSVPLPDGGKSASMVVGNVIYVVLKSSKHRDIAAQWVKFLARDDVQDLVYPVLGRLPSTKSALMRLRPNVNSANQAFIDELLNDSELSILPQWRKEPQQLWTIYNDMLKQVLTTEQPIQSIIDQAQVKADAVMQQKP
ncbi:MAG: extracellular solute-binding protein [Chloroflexi bacterium]|nr:extracellular solute-binding protein [Chloroflexota bacterium]